MRHSLLVLVRMIVLLPSYALVLLIRLLKWLIAPPILLLQMLIGVPLILLRVRQPLRPRFVPLQESELPDAAWIAFADVAETLVAAGFVHYGDFRCDEAFQGAVLRLRLLGQPEQGIGALATQLEFKTSGRPSRQFVQFLTEFADGRVLVTDNFDLPYSLPPPAYLARLQLKDVWDPRALYVLHRDLSAALPQAINAAKIEQAARNPASLLVDGYAREIQALLDQGWLHPVADGSRFRLSLRGALVGVWRQAWPLTGLHLRAADRRARRLLAGHGITAGDFVGSALSIVVARQPLPAEAAGTGTIRAGYEYVRPLARQTAPSAVLEAVAVELACDALGATVPREFRYSFRGCEDQPERRIRRLCGFDILLDPGAGLLSVTAMDREFEQADDEAEWAELAASPLKPLRIEPWLRDLDTVLPVALKALATHADAAHITADSALLYTGEDGAPHWEVIAWKESGPPLHVAVDARTGTVVAGADHHP